MKIFEGKKNSPGKGGFNISIKINKKNIYIFVTFIEHPLMEMFADYGTEK